MKSTLIKEITIVIFITFLGYYEVDGQIMIGSTPVDTQSVITGLDTPWEILWGQDDHIWFTERPGRVNRLNPETGQNKLLLTIPDVHEQSESGLLGMALHPVFIEFPFVYLVYNYFSGSIKERIIRYTFTGDSLVNPDTLLDNIGGAGNHNGSRIVAGNDFKLYISTGDATNTSTSQNLSSLSGKILRMNLDGTIPEDNPINDSYIWTYGHRNPQGIVVTPDGNMYSSEHGPDEDDEINLIEVGRNYGWPDIHGFCDEVSEMDFCSENNVREPLFAWTPTLAVAGIDYYFNDAIPEWNNSILMTTLKEQELLSLALSEDGKSITGTSTYFNNWFGRLRDVCISPDGRVFIATSNRDGRGNPDSEDDRIVEIRTIQIPDHLTESKKEKSITVFPNPMTDNSIVYLSREFIGGRIFVFNLSGNLIFEDSILNDKYILGKEKLKPGFFIIKVSNGKILGKSSLVVI